MPPPPDDDETLVPAPLGAAVAPPGPDAVAVAREAFLDAARAPATRHAYERDWQRFVRWARERSLSPMPASAVDVADYITWLATERRAAPATIERALSAIAEAHRIGGHESPRGAPLVRETRKGIRRTLGVAPRKRAPALTVVELRAMCLACGDDLAGLRDRALLLVGFAAALRQSELVALDVRDVERVPEGLRVQIRRSKTDQEGAGRLVGVPFGSDPRTCPVRSLDAWLTAAAIASGRVFRPIDRHGRIRSARKGAGAASDGLSARSIAVIIVRAAERAALARGGFSGHSLRAGLATAAAAAGKSDAAIQAQTGHRSREMVAVYTRPATLFTDNAAAGIGL